MGSTGYASLHAQLLLSAESPSSARHITDNRQVVVWREGGGETVYFILRAYSLTPVKIQKFYEKCDKEGYICYEHFAEGALNSYFMNLFMYKFGDNFDYVWDYIESHIMSDNISYDKVLVEVTDFYLDLLNKKYDK